MGSNKVKFRIKEIVNNNLQRYFYVQYKVGFFWKYLTIAGNQPATFWNYMDAQEKVNTLRKSGPPKVQYHVA